MPPPPPGIVVERREDAVELMLDRPLRRIRGALCAGAFGIGFVVTVVAAALDPHAPKEPAFVLATVLFAVTVGAIRSAVLGRRPLRILIDKNALRVANARPWSGQNRDLPRASIRALEQTATGISVRAADGTIVPLVGDLSAEQVIFLEGVVSRELGQRT